MTLNLDPLIPQEPPLPPSFRYATVTATAPLRIRLDGDEAPLPITPASLVAPTVGDRVLVGIHNRRVTVFGTLDAGQSLALPLAQGTGFVKLTRRDGAVSVLVDVSASFGTGDQALASGVPLGLLGSLPEGAIFTGASYTTPANSGVLYVNSVGNVRHLMTPSGTTRIRGVVTWTF